MKCTKNLMKFQRFDLGTLYKLLGKLKLDIFLKVILIHKPTPIKMDRLCRNPSIFIMVIEFLQRFMYPDSI